MEESTSDEYQRTQRRTIPIIRYGKRLLSQTPIPSNTDALRQLNLDQQNLHPSRKKRAASEQYHRRDR